MRLRNERFTHIGFYPSNVGSVYSGLKGLTTVVYIVDASSSLLMAMMNQMTFIE